MKIKIEHELEASKIELTEQELLDNFIVRKKYDIHGMFRVADKAMSEVSWMNNMPKSTKLEFISMLSKHIAEFMKDIDHNNDLEVK